MFEEARRKYKPAMIKYLLVAEAPPQIKTGRFFYYEKVKDHDGLFLETMKALYPNEYIDVKSTRRDKQIFLNKFKADCYYLLDAANEPIKDIRRKEEQLKSDLPSLVERIREVINPHSKIILISRPVYNVCFARLIAEGFRVINTEMIDFPGSGGQVKFRNKIRSLINDA